MKSNHKKTNAVRFHLHELSKLVKFIETKSRVVETKDSGEDRLGRLLMGPVPVLQDEKVLKICFITV